MEDVMGVTRALINKIRGDLNLMKETSPGLKPNFSELSREHGISRQTIAKIWNEPNRGNKPRKKRKSMLDPYYEEIKRKFEEGPYSIKSVFMYFKARYPDSAFSSYNTFKAYVKRHDLKKARQEYLRARPRYESGPGKEVQLDWKESMTMTLTTGEVIEFNIFTAVYGYSRYVKLVYSKTKTTEDFIRCLLETVNSVGGLPELFKTDNMSAVVTVNGKRKQKLPIIRQLEKDVGTPIHLCRVHNPQGKGKVESANRLIAWLQPYQGELKSEEELIQTIEKINRQINQESSRTTGQVRALLMRKEKEHLRPLNRPLLLESYLTDVDTQVVPATSMVIWKGHGYSVPVQFVGKRVKLVPCSDELRIYYNQKLLCTHKLSSQTFNYKEDHYIGALKKSIPKKEEESKESYDEMIKRKAQESLEHMKHLKGTVK